MRAAFRSDLLVPGRARLAVSPRRWLALCVLAGAGGLSACAPRPVPVAAAPVAPDPFGYIRKSAVCTPGPVVATANGGHVATMAVRSDDGECQLPVTLASFDPPVVGKKKRDEAPAPDVAFASFLMQTAPLHGKAFIYNYNNRTLITYTPTTAYAGPDSFTVSLIPAVGKPRTLLQVNATVDATGVTPPPAPVAPKAAPTTSSTSKARSTSRSRRKK
ncbi:hypothetical protein [Rhizosaccharibacter radicis]|uniref:Lipoprotein n=1 Tax=Rhizosaccharibacter radicis TaxID=2782605 RepID=A0ABT1W1A9_9PROT|nr:hypothetical protein [Acetobacteraceae bacterium KSS12]